MPGNSDTNGEILYFDKPPINQTVNVTQDTTSSTEVISGLYACNIQTDIIGVSIKIQIGLTIYAHIELQGVTSVDLVGNTLQLNNSDQLPILLSFVDVSETQNALGLLEDAINGKYINCSDTIITTTLTLNPYVVDGTFSYPCLVFANEQALGKASNQTQAINLLNIYGDFNYTVIAGGNNQTFIFTCTKEFVSYIPNSINCLTTFFTCLVDSPSVNFQIDYTNRDKFWVYYDNKLVVGTTTQQITFINPSNNSFDLFYVNDYLNLLNLSNNKITSIIGQLPVELQNLNLLTTAFINCSFLANLSSLKTFNISQTSSNSIDFIDNTGLISIIIMNSGITTITGTASLFDLNSFTAINLPITSTPDFSMSAISLKTLDFEGCNFISSLSSIASNINLTTYIVSQSSLSSSSLDLTHNTKLNTLILSSNSIMTFSSLINNTLLSQVDVSFDDLLSTTVESIVHDLANNVIVRNGTLNLTNQQTSIDYTSLNDQFTIDLDKLRVGMSWTVNL